MIVILLMALIGLALYAWELKDSRDFYCRREKDYYDRWIQETHRSSELVLSFLAQCELGHRERCQSVLTENQEACNCGFVEEDK